MAGKHHGLHVKYLFWSWTGNVIKKNGFIAENKAGNVWTSPENRPVLSPRTQLTMAPLKKIQMLPKKEARFAASSLINSKYFPYWKPRSAAERILSECVKKRRF